MADIFTTEKRSEIMKKIKPSNNKTTELQLIAVFNDLGIKGWRRHYKVKGHPDFIFQKQKIAIFVDGCFWHGHNCRNTTPMSNKEYWDQKRIRNIKHDQETTKRFERRGWLVIRIWECELKKNQRYILLDKLKPLTLYCQP